MTITGLKALAQIFPNVNPFKIIVILFFNSFALFSIFCIIFGTVIASMTNKIVRIVALAFSMVSMFGLSFLIMTPKLVKMILDFLPLITGDFILNEGYSLSLTAHYLCILASAMMFLDILAPPFAPEIPPHYAEESAQRERDRLDPIYFDYYLNKAFESKETGKKNRDSKELDMGFSLSSLE